MTTSILRVLAFVGVAFVLAACQQQRMITQLEYDAATLHEFAGFTPEQVAKASRQVLTLLDGEDFKFEDTRIGFVGRREWFNFALIAAESGTDQWEFRVGQDAGITKARMEITRTAGGGMITPFGGGYYNQPQTIFNGVAVYAIFWERVDYMLGRRQHWTTCDDMRSRIRAKSTWGDLSAMCDGNNKNDTPAGPMIPYSAPPAPVPPAGQPAPATGA